MILVVDDKNAGEKPYIREPINLQGVTGIIINTGKKLSFTKI